MTDDLAIKLKYLEPIDLAPATPEAEHIRAAISARLPTLGRYNSTSYERCLIEADIIDEQHLLGVLKALIYGDLADLSRESLASTIVQRARAELEFLIEHARTASCSTPVKEMIIDQHEYRLACLRSGLPSELVARSPEVWIYGAVLLTEAQIERFEQQRQAKQELLRELFNEPGVASDPAPVDGSSAASNIPMEILEEPMDDDCGDGGSGQVDDQPSLGETAMRIWLDDKQMRTKYRGSFRHYLQAEHNLL